MKSESGFNLAIASQPLPYSVSQMLWFFWALINTNKMEEGISVLGLGSPTRAQPTQYFTPIIISFPWTTRHSAHPHTIVFTAFFLVRELVVEAANIKLERVGHVFELSIVPLCFSLAMYILYLHLHLHILGHWAILCTLAEMSHSRCAP